MITYKTIIRCFWCLKFEMFLKITYFYCVILMFFLVTKVYGRPEIQLTNKNASSITSFLTSSYAQVSRWGAGSKTDEARSNVGQTPWTQSSDAHIIRGQNLMVNKNRRVKISNKNYDAINDDSTGEVIQERFNPRPWLAYEITAGKGPTYIPPAKPSDNKQPDYAAPGFDSYPLTVNPSDIDKPSLPKLPIYSTDKSLIDMGIDTDAVVDSYPEKPPIYDETDSNGPPPNTYGSPYNSYYPEEPDKTPNHAPKQPSNFVTRPYDYLPPEMEKSPKETEMPNHSEDDSKGNHYTSDHPKLVDSHYFDHDHSIYDAEVPKDAPSDSHGAHDFPALPTFLEHDPYVHGNTFDHYHYPYDHHPHIYHEVKTTTTEEPEKERLSKRPYSYYYLGRKLWYIPLYFSVYFIIYIFVLILKSIARHKITFNQYFEQDKREMKDTHETHEEHVRELGDHLSKEINDARRKYVM